MIATNHFENCLIAQSIYFLLLICHPLYIYQIFWVPSSASWQSCWWQLASCWCQQETENRLWCHAPVSVCQQSVRSQSEDHSSYDTSPTNSHITFTYQLIRSNNNSLASLVPSIFTLSQTRLLQRCVTNHRHPVLAFNQATQCTQFNSDWTMDIPL